jgi:hypothetical protein
VRARALLLRRFVHVQPLLLAPATQLPLASLPPFRSRLITPPPASRASFYHLRLSGVKAAGSVAVAPTTPGAAAGRSCGRGSHGRDATASSQPPLLHQLLTPAGPWQRGSKRKRKMEKQGPGIQETAAGGRQAQQKAGASLEAHAQRHTHPSDLSPMHGRIGSEHASYFLHRTCRDRLRSYLARCSPSRVASADLHLHWGWAMGRRGAQAQRRAFA